MHLKKMQMQIYKALSFTPYLYENISGEKTHNGVFLTHLDCVYVSKVYFL